MINKKSTVVDSMKNNHPSTPVELSFSKDTHVVGSTGFRFGIGQNWEWIIDPVHPLNVRMGV